jgi:hypothetical protein
MRVKYEDLRLHDVLINGPGNECLQEGAESIVRIKDSIYCVICTQG